MITKIWQALQEVKDPEIPVISVVEMGMVREVEVAEDGAVRVTITPTFAGCPALEVIQKSIREAVLAIDYNDVTVETTFTPAWSSDWITDAGRAKLKQFGLAPPPIHQGAIELVLAQPMACPRCDATETEVSSNFGTTLCRSIHTCHACHDSFEGFKPL